MLRCFFFRRRRNDSLYNDAALTECVCSDLTVVSDEILDDVSAVVVPAGAAGGAVAFSLPPDATGQPGSRPSIEREKAAN